VPLLVDAGLIQPALVSKGDAQRYEAAFERAHRRAEFSCLFADRVSDAADPTDAAELMAAAGALDGGEERGSRVA